jgi:Transposase DDE domain
MVFLNDPILQGGTSMHHRIDTILKRLRQDLARELSPESILSASRAAGHVWRKCTLNPAAIVHWFVIQVLHGNTALEHVARLGGGLFTGAAYCLARSALPLAVFQNVLHDLVKALLPETHAECLWRGHRTFLTDGSSFSMPDTPELQKQFGQSGAQKPGCGFPVAKILALFHAGTGVLLKVMVTPLRSHEMASVNGIHPALEPGDVLVGDRGFCSFAHLAILMRDGVYAVFRVHQRQIVGFTPNRPHARPGAKRAAKGLPRSRWLRSLGVLDQVVEWFKPEERPEWMTAEQYAELPETLTVRELRYDVGRPGFRTRTVTLVTTLLNAEAYPLEALAELYWARWRVELNLRHLKTTMKLDVLKCKTVAGVLKELTVYAIVYNLVRVVMMEAARRQGVDVERISFVDALRWLGQAKPGEELPKLVVNPDRPGRYEPRAKKRRPKQYDLMNKPRSVLRKGLLNKSLSLA